MAPTMSTRPPPKPPFSSASQAGTPISTQQLLTHSELGASLIGVGGLVKSPTKVHRWLEAKGWILAGELYDCMKLAHVLMTMAIALKGPKLESEAKNAILMVAFLLEDDINDKVLATLADAIASKVIKHVEPIIHHAAKSVDFISANGTSQAETILALKGVSSQLELVTNSLNDVVSKLATMSPPSLPSHQPLPPHPTWASIAGSTPPSVSPDFNLSAAPQHTRLQQRLLHDAKTVLVAVDTVSTNAPVEHRLAANTDLHAYINKLLSEIDKTGADIAAIDGVPPTPSKTHVQGIT
ncbi:hypothetical protein C0992_012918 [Termitomyces sp. T32_za158]|nr:hypothetical protein C0992_012918 [Termitomyces sp. T32_za158]